MDKPIYKSKTFWTGVSGLIAAAGTWVTGETSLGETIQIMVTCLVGIFLRSGMMRPS